MSARHHTPKPKGSFPTLNDDPLIVINHGTKNVAGIVLDKMKKLKTRVAQSKVTKTVNYFDFVSPEEEVVREEDKVSLMNRADEKWEMDHMVEKEWEETLGYF